MTIKRSSKRITPEDDFKRMALNLYVNLGSVIKDRDSFDKAYDEYFQVKLIPARGKKQVKGQCWDAYEQKYIKPSPAEFTDVKKFKNFNKKIKPKRQKPEYQYNVVGRRKNSTTNKTQIVYARELKTKKGTKYIDQRGKFVSITRK